MTFDEFVAFAAARFHVKISHYKSKAGHEMVDVEGFGTESIVGPEAGYRIQSRFWCITLNGWAYTWDGSAWWLVRDGKNGWRQGQNPFPDIPEAADDNPVNAFGA